MNGRFAKTPQPPYYAVIFTSRLSDDGEGYAETLERVLELALQEHGCLGLESARDGERVGITVSYWADEESISAWKVNAEHVAAQRMGISRWYAYYELRVARVERGYSGPAGRHPS